VGILRRVEVGLLLGGFVVVGVVVVEVDMTVEI
jgi:hypothetical protein